MLEPPSIIDEGFFGVAEGLTRLNSWAQEGNKERNLGKTSLVKSLLLFWEDFLFLPDSYIQNFSTSALYSLIILSSLYFYF